MRSPGRACTRAVGVLAASAVVFAPAACSDSGSGSGSQPREGTVTASTVDGVQQVTIDADDDNRFTPSTIVVRPGKVRIVLDNVGKGAPHNWSLTGLPADFIPVTSSGEKQAATFTAPSPGSYRFVCTLHVKEGMTGKLVVLPK